MIRATQSRWAIGELARACGTTPRAIRHYERAGIIAPAGRASNGYRFFSPSIEHEIRLIMMMLSVGLTLAEIRDILAPNGPLHKRVESSIEAARQMTQAITVYQRHLASNRERIAALQEHEHSLSERIGHCEAWLKSARTQTKTPPTIAGRSIRPGRVEYTASKPAAHPPSQRSRRAK